MSTEPKLNWTESEGVWKASANGFVYSIWRADEYGYIKWACDIGSFNHQAYKQKRNSVDKCKEICQSHADTVNAAIAKACAEEKALADRIANAAGILYDECERGKEWKRHDSTMPLAMANVREALSLHHEVRK